MSLLAQESLRALEAWTAPDEEQESLRASYVDHLRAHPDGMLRTCYPDHLTASAIVVSADRARVLLTLHRKAQRWFQLGGHLEPGDDTLAGAALREATEESGITGLTGTAAPVHLDRHCVPFCDPRGGVRHLDVRYVLLAPESARPAVSAESLDVRWWPVDALPEEELGPLVDRALVELDRIG